MVRSEVPQIAPSDRSTHASNLTMHAPHAAQRPALSLPVMPASQEAEGATTRRHHGHIGEPPAVRTLATLIIPLHSDRVPKPRLAGSFASRTNPVQPRHARPFSRGRWLSHGRLRLHALACVGLWHTVLPVVTSLTASEALSAPQVREFRCTHCTLDPLGSMWRTEDRSACVQCRVYAVAVCECRI